MNTGTTHFKKGNRTAAAKQGRKHKSTLIKAKLGINNLHDLEQDLIKSWYEMLHSKCKTDKRFALKEISRYVFPMKKEVKETVIFDEAAAKKKIEDMFQK
jgi:hypothetical protein